MIQEQAQGRGGGLAAQRKKPGRWARDWSRSICLVALMSRPRRPPGSAAAKPRPLGLASGAKQGSDWESSDGKRGAMSLLGGGLVPAWHHPSQI